MLEPSHPLSPAGPDAATAAASLFRLTDRLYRASGLPDVLDAALDAIVETTGCRRASILLFDDAGVMRFAAWRGLYERYRAAVDGHSPWTPDDRDPPPLFVRDIEETDEPGWLKAEILREGIRALGFVPLVRDGRVAGKFMIYHPEPRSFGEDEVALAVTVARQVGFSLERAEADAARRAAAEELRLSESRFRTMAEEAPVMIWISDTDGRCLHLNRLLRTAWGVDEAAVATFDWRGTVHPDDVDRVQAVMTAAVATRAPADLTARYRTADGRYRTWSTQACPQFGAGGEFKGFIGVNVDVTEREDAERALRASERRFRELAEVMPQLVWTADGAGTVDYWNGRIALYRGAPRDGEPLLWQDIIHPDDLERTAREWTGSVEDGVAFQITHRLLMADGSARWHLSRATPLFGETGTLDRWYGTATDVHDLTRAEERLSESEQRQRLAVRAAGLGVFEWTLPTGAGIFENARMSELLGLAADEPPPDLGTFGRAVVVPEDRASFEAAVDEARGGGTMHAAVRIRRRGDGALRWLEMAARTMADGPRRRLVGVAADVTDRVREDELRRLLIHELNHRVKNNLAVVQGIARRTFGAYGGGDPRLATFEGRLMALAGAHDLLASENWTRADLRDLAEGALFARAPGDRRIRVAGPAVELGPKQATAIALSLHELVTNAIKYGALSVPEGRVDLAWTLEPGEPPVLVLTWRESGGPRVEPPTRRGFGSVMIETALRSELDAKVDLAFPPEGLSWTVRAALPGGPPPAW